MISTVRRSNYGFTLIELLVVISLLAIVLTIGTTNLFRPVPQAKVDQVRSDLISLLREAQSKTMNSDNQGGGITSEFGVKIETSEYILFAGNSYNPNDENNFAVPVPAGITLHPNLPSDGNTTVVFEKLTGEVNNFNFTSPNNTICIRENTTSESIELEINFVGVVNVLKQPC